MKYFGVTLASTEATHITRDNFYEPPDLTIRKRLLFNYALKNRRWIKVNGFLRRPGEWLNEKEAFEGDKLNVTHATGTTSATVSRLLSSDQ